MVREHARAAVETMGYDSFPEILEKIIQERGIINVSNLLGNIIDFDESLQEDAVIIRSGVSEVLDAARACYEDLDNVGCFPHVQTMACLYGQMGDDVVPMSGQVLTEVAYQIQETDASLSSITVQYIPQVGYVVCCDSPTALPDFVFQFQEDDATFYYKVRAAASLINARWPTSRELFCLMEDGCCRDLDTSIGDIFGTLLLLVFDLVPQSPSQTFKLARFLQATLSTFKEVIRYLEIYYDLCGICYDLCGSFMLMFVSCRNPGRGYHYAARARDKHSW